MSEDNRQESERSASAEAQDKEETRSQDFSGGGEAEPGSGEQNGGQVTLEQALEKLARTEQALVAQQDEVLRTRAEMQNLRRRTEMDIEKAHKFGQERLVNELLSVIDNLERALQAVTDKDDQAVRPLYEGVELTLKGFLGALEKFSVAQLDPHGQAFDPLVHEAMTTQENPDVEPNTVIAVMQKGYTLHGRVIRPARVVVSRASSSGISEQA
jgi:molecular chaperone GrpE